MKKWVELLSLLPGNMLPLKGTWLSLCNGKCLGLIQQDRPLMLFLVKDINLEWSSTLDILFFKSTWGIVKYLMSTPDTQTPFQEPYNSGKGLSQNFFQFQFPWFILFFQPMCFAITSQHRYSSMPTQYSASHYVALVRQITSKWEPLDSGRLYMYATIDIWWLLRFWRVFLHCSMEFMNHPHRNIM